VADGDVTLRTKLVGEDRMSPAFNKAGNSADHLSTRMVAVGTAIGHLAAGGILALGGMAAGAIKTGIQTAAAMQQAQLGFATLLGSEKAAGDYMKWLTGFAAATPFELQGLVQSSRTLIGVGVSAKDAKVMLQNFGDTASAIGIDQDAFQRVMLATSQAISAGKFQAGDLNQIMTNGIPVWTILSKAMHKSVPELRDLASHGKLLAKDVLPALQAEMHKDYGGAMAKQSQTLNGLWSTFQDTIHLGMANVLQPLIPMLQGALPGAMDTLGKAFGGVAKALKDFFEGFKNDEGGASLSKTASAFQILGVGVRSAILAFQDGEKTSTGFIGAMESLGIAARGAFQLITSTAKAAWPVLVGAFNTIINVINFIAEHSTVFGALATSIGTVVAIIKVWQIVTRTFIAVQAALNLVLSLNPIGLVILAVAGLAAGLVYAYKHSQTFRDIVNGVWASVKGFVIGAIDKIKGAYTTLVTAGGKVITWFQQLPGKIAGFLKSLPGRMLEIGKQAMVGLGKGIADNASLALNPAAAIGGKIGDVISGALGIHSPSRVTMKIGENVIRGLLEGLKQEAPTVFTFLSNFAKRIGDMKVTAGIRDDVKLTASPFIEALRNMGAAMPGLTDKIKDQQQAYDDLVKARDDYAKQLSQGINGGGSIAGIGLAKDEVDSDGNVTKKADVVGEFVKSLQAKSDAITKFGNDVNGLRAEGLSAAVIQQIEQAGLETGGALASALATATPEAVRSINALSDQVTAESNKMGKQWAGEMYQSGVDAAKGLLEGLKSQKSQLLEMIRKMAQEMVAEIKATLKIKSPSGVMADEVGAMIPAGLIAGIQGGAGGVASAMASLVRVPQVGAVGVGLGQSIATGGVRGGDTHVHIHMQNGIVGDAQQVATYVSDVIRRSNNRGSGLSFA
jgi:tape measure domain-containing protein